MPLSWFDRVLFSAVQRAAGAAPVRLAMGTPDHSVTTMPSSVPTVWIKDQTALRRLARNPQINFGDLYSDGAIEVEGDLVDLIERLYQVPVSLAARIYSKWLSWVESNSL